MSQKQVNDLASKNIVPFLLSTGSVSQIHHFTSWQGWHALLMWVGLLFPDAAAVWTQPNKKARRWKLGHTNLGVLSSLKCDVVE